MDSLSASWRGQVDAALVHVSQPSSDEPIYALLEVQRELGIVKPKALLPRCCLLRLLSSQHRPKEPRNRPLPSLCFPPLCSPSLSSPPLLIPPSILCYSFLFSPITIPSLSFSPLPSLRLSCMSSPLPTFCISLVSLCCPVLEFVILHFSTSLVLELYWKNLGTWREDEQPGPFGHR